MSTLISMGDHRRRIANGEVAQREGLAATLKRATRLFHFGGLPKIICDFNVQIFRTQMECRLSRFCLAKKIGDMEYFCCMCALGVFCTILTIPSEWRKRDFREEFQRDEENMGILTDAGYTALFFLTFDGNLALSTEQELIRTGTYLFDKHFFFTGKESSLYLKDNFLGMRDILQKIQTSYY